MPSLLLLNKPFATLSQFTDADGHPGLGRLLTKAQVGECYPAGRLDRDSEGLLVLTDNGWLQHRLANPAFKVEKTYLAQVEGAFSQDMEKAFATGLQLKDGPTLPAKVEAIEEPSWLWLRDPPIRYRKNDRTSWLKISIREGRNRQVRRMTAAVGLPTLRLVRTGFGAVDLFQERWSDLRKPAKLVAVDPEAIDSRLKFRDSNKPRAYDEKPSLAPSRHRRNHRRTRR